MVNFYLQRRKIYSINAIPYLASKCKRGGAPYKSHVVNQMPFFEAVGPTPSVTTLDPPP
jgi:hypothetical protein